MVSLTTDGARNMNGQARGMTAELLKLVNEAQNLNLRRGIDVSCLWCLDHRLNLVAQDFWEVENINLVILFVRWITLSDRLTKYRNFTRVMFPTLRKKMVPPLSETRWLFMRDALRALLDQTEVVEAFLDSDDNRAQWIRYSLTASEHPLGPLQNIPLTFGNPIVNAHFRFALFLLDSWPS